MMRPYLAVIITQQALLLQMQCATDRRHRDRRPLPLLSPRRPPPPPLLRRHPLRPRLLLLSLPLHCVARHHRHHRFPPFAPFSRLSFFPLLPFWLLLGHFSRLLSSHRRPCRRPLHCYFHWCS
ncbi:unnamed protein product [Chrysodeixis includens]|uniref:Uncharacterized protein n=1 Tax=Chrysodeixis includens TaxID=689277 RepID=A0A9N8L0W8_CHRIL|nr:unnamed protein product [Chrysodeixis includens]